MRFAYPRYYSLAVAGDIGVQNDLERIRDAGLLGKIMTRTAASQPLREALNSGKSVQDVVPWQYRPSNIQAAAAHYVDSMAKLGNFLEPMAQLERIRAVQMWLEHACSAAGDVREAGLRSSRNTELTHQNIWLDVFQSWRSSAGL